MVSYSWFARRGLPRAAEDARISPIADGTRAGAEFAAMQAVIRLDAARAPNGEARDAQ